MSDDGLYFDTAMSSGCELGVAAEVTLERISDRDSPNSAVRSAEACIVEEAILKLLILSRMRYDVKRCEENSACVSVIPFRCTRGRRNIHK